MRGEADEEDGDQPLAGFILWVMRRSQGFILSRMTDSTCCSEGNLGRFVENGLRLRRSIQGNPFRPRERQRETGGRGGDKPCLSS